MSDEAKISWLLTLAFQTLLLKVSENSHLSIKRKATHQFIFNLLEILINSFVCFSTLSVPKSRKLSLPKYTKKEHFEDIMRNLLTVLGGLKCISVPLKCIIQLLVCY